MKTVIINENERGLRFKNGKFDGLLMPGSYLAFGSTEIEAVRLNAPLVSTHCPYDILISKKVIADAVNTLTVPDGCLALHYLNGNFDSVLRAGNYAYFKVGAHKFKIIDLSEPRISGDALKVINQIPCEYFSEFVVNAIQRGLLYYDGKFVGKLEPGRYFFWNDSARVTCDFVNITPTMRTISGQELLTSDKIGLRISYVFFDKVVDFDRIIEAGDYVNQLYTAAQLAMRDYVGSHTLDEILENKQEFSDVIDKKLKEKAAGLFVEITGSGVKDIILPGEIRDIMNTVLIAEKRAQANVITRREEVASTRSLLNTAKLMDENKTLYRLKELEYLGKICDQVGNITLSGQGDILSQLAALTGTDKK